jgi:SAM-dependent methyltransferase
VHTDYLAHDAVYKQRQAAGSPGWELSEEPYNHRRRQIAERLASQNVRSGTILEFGCGAGNIAVWLASLGYQATGVDISPTAVAWARNRARSANVPAEFLVADILDLNQFEGGAFDVVLDDHCFHCIIGDDRRRFLAEARRLLKKNGLFLMETMCGPVDPNVIEGYDPETQCSLRGPWATRYFGSSGEITTEILAAGFCILRSAVEQDTANGVMTIDAIRHDD